MNFDPPGIDRIVERKLIAEVGDAALEWGSLMHRPMGLYLALSSKGKVAEALAQWPY